MKQSNSIEVFLDLLKAGLWERDTHLQEYGAPVHDGETAIDETVFVEVVRFRICPRGQKYGIQIPLGGWHSIEVHEPSTVFEAKDGAYGK